VILLGSSLGGSAAIELTARHPEMVSRLILNDIGPYIPKKRRQRRSQTLARHYVLPRARGPAAQDRRLAEERRPDQRRHPLQRDLPPDALVRRGGGRVYRHDVRALQAFRTDAQEEPRPVGACGAR
jgi:pimeloyl-ACP methyl ester carboxylesterase